MIFELYYYWLMSNNKKVKNMSPNYRLRTLENPYICGKDHRQPTANSQQRFKMDQVLKKKLDLTQKKGRVQSLPNEDSNPRRADLSRSTKLQPIKQAKMRGKDSRVHEKVVPSPEDEKAIRLKVFMNSKDVLIDHWRRQEMKQKEEYLQKLKLAATSPSPPRLTKKKELKQSLKNIHQKEAGGSREKKMSGSTLILPKVPNINPNMTIEELQAEMQKYYIENMLELMEHNKKNLVSNKKELSKKIRHEQKEHLMQAKNEIARAIEEDLRRHEQLRNQQKMEQYRKQLEDELQTQMYSQRQRHNYEPSLHEDVQPVLTRMHSSKDDSHFFQNPQPSIKPQMKRDASTYYEDLGMVSQYKKAEVVKPEAKQQKRQRDEATIYEDPQKIVVDNKKDAFTLYEDPTATQGKQREEVNPQVVNKMKRQEKSKSMTELDRLGKFSRALPQPSSNAQKLKISKLLSKEDSSKNEELTRL